MCCIYLSKTLTDACFQVGSRLVFQLGGFCVILLAIVGKFSAVFVSIPDPVFGGLTIASIATLTGVGIASLNTVNLSLSRNYVTLGFSLILGILLPRWVQNNPGDINTGKTTQFSLPVFAIGYSLIYDLWLCGFQGWRICKNNWIDSETQLVHKDGGHITACVHMRNCKTWRNETQRGQFMGIYIINFHETKINTHN